ncbi:TetR/AcrR family transcriptional regulator [Pseudobacillus sp. 179-B 2D1 NHS]|uniref:TetR/AcrR family transcriptional regulator n=1 Tax=Pseudobacillus sp. 179-B 2D1 NHS TaxID=3374292 RepID=UPI00387A233D
MRFPLINLARRLGVSKKTLYKYFDSKADMLNAVIDYTFANMDEKANTIIKNEELSIIEKIKGVMAVLPDHYEFIDVNILEQMKRYYPEQWIKMDTLLKSDWELLRDLIEQAIEENAVINANISLVMKVVIDSLNTTLDQNFFFEHRMTVNEALSEIANILIYGLATRE